MQTRYDEPGALNLSLKCHAFFVIICKVWHPRNPLKMLQSILPMTTEPLELYEYAFKAFG